MTTYNMEHLSSVDNEESDEDSLGHHESFTEYAIPNSIVPSNELDDHYQERLTTTCAISSSYENNDELYTLPFSVCKENAEKREENEKDEVDVTPQKVLEDLQLEVLERNKRNTQLNETLREISSNFYMIDLAANGLCEREEKKRAYEESLFVTGFDHPEKDVCEYKDNILHKEEKMARNLKKSDSCDGKLNRIQSEHLGVDTCGPDRIVSTSSDESSSTVEGAAGGIPYSLILKQKLNEKQKRRRLNNKSADRRMKQFSKRHPSKAKDRSYYLKSPTSDTSDDDPNARSMEFLLLRDDDRHNLSVEQIPDLNNQINEKLRLADWDDHRRHSALNGQSGYVFPESNRSRRSARHSYAYGDPVVCDQTGFHENQTSTQSNICSGYDPTAVEYPAESCNTRTSRETRQSSQGQNHYCTGGARPKKL